MEQLSKIESINNNPKDVEVRSIEKEKLEEIMEEYKKDPDNFYRKNAFVLWDEGKNPALIFSVELVSKFTKEIYEEKGMGNASNILNDARNAAMFVMKYLGADIEGWCKVDIKTVTEIDDQMRKDDHYKDQVRFILEKIKKNDPVFAKFLTKLCVIDPKTGKERSDNDRTVMVEMVGYITRIMYEQMQKDAKIN